MALGILNNLSAVYAENNLNNTNSSLQKVLQQLSSGSRINSGADDAAGLSLVNGLAANSAALIQSKTNATEGVGLLQVADGALAQVTSLLNRAITLATEASNGTLNSTQSAAANQEYQTILAEVNNIGSTTTYNQRQVFNGTAVAIYSGDSSASGASVDNLYIRNLSVTSLGDKNGIMSYNNGLSNVFIDLSKNGVLATVNDAFVNATTTLDINYMSTGANGAVTQQSATVSVGGATGYANNVSGLVGAINNAHLGVTASFGTASQAGTQAVAAGTANDTGIILSGTGTGIGSGATPGLVGTLASTGLANDALSGSLTVTDTSGVVHSITLGTAGSTDTLSNLANTINAAGYGITATYNAGSKSTTFTSASSQAAITASGLGDTTTPADVPTWAAGTYYTIGVSNSAAGTAIANAATGQTAGAASGFTADPTGLGGLATVSYTDSAGTDLSGSSLASLSNAQSALILINEAISNIASMDGYIGAQINTLNSISQVMSTQQENVLSAQNAVQATDYASATANMSKYEILSQTGIAALAQANQVQQEVTKLLQ